MKAKHLALAGIASAFLWASTANSATVTIGAAPGAGPASGSCYGGDVGSRSDIVLVHRVCPSDLGRI